MGAAAQFLAEGVDLHHSHLVAILVAEKGQCPPATASCTPITAGLHPVDLADLLINDRFDLVDVTGTTWAGNGQSRTAGDSALPTSRTV